MTEETKKALAAVDVILDSIANSTFAAEYGTNAVEALREYRLDMAGDILRAFTGRDLTEEEIRAELLQ